MILSLAILTVVLLLVGFRLIEIGGRVEDRLRNIEDELRRHRPDPPKRPKEPWEWGLDPLEDLPAVPHAEAPKPASAPIQNFCTPCLVNGRGKVKIEEGFQCPACRGETEISSQAGRLTVTPFSET